MPIKSYFEKQNYLIYQILSDFFIKTSLSMKLQKIMENAISNKFSGKQDEKAKTTHPTT